MEDTEIIRIALQGSEMSLRLAGSTVKEGMKFLKFLIMVLPSSYRWWQETADKAYKKKLTKEEYKIIKNRKDLAKGSMDLNKFMKIFSAEERTMLSIPDESAEKFEQLAKKNKLTFALLPDLNFSDGMFQVIVPNSQSDLYRLVLEGMMKEESVRNEGKINSLKKELDEIIKEEAVLKNDKKSMEKEGLNESEPEKYKEITDRLNEIEITKEQIQTEIEDIKNMYSKEITYEDYMKTNLHAFNHADMFCDLMDKGVTSDLISIENFILSPENIEFKYKELAFEQAVTDVTELTLKNSERVILCDSLNPENYIEAYTYQKENDDGKEFVVTQYDVYTGGIKQRCDEFSHGEFTHYSDGLALNKSDEGNTHWQNMKAEMRKKCINSEKVLMFSDKSQYEKYLQLQNNKNITQGYLVHPDVPEIAVKKESGYTAGKPVNKYTLLKNDKETKISFEIGKGVSDVEKASYIRVLTNEIKKLNKDTDLTLNWMQFNNTDDYKSYVETTKKKIVNDKEVLNEEAEQVLGNDYSRVKENIIHQEKMNSESIVLPDEQLLIIRDEFEKVTGYTVFSPEKKLNELKYMVNIPIENIKINNEGKKIVVFDKDISFKTSEKSDGKWKDIEPIKSSYDLRSLINGTMLSDTGINKLSESPKKVGKEIYASKIQK